jgi:hypothetical protein
MVQPALRGVMVDLAVIYGYKVDGLESGGHFWRVRVERRRLAILPQILRRHLLALPAGLALLEQ